MTLYDCLKDSDDNVEVIVIKKNDGISDKEAASLAITILEDLA